jgi:UV DNA damage endonuclease
MTRKYIRLGLCCLNTTLRKQKPPVFASRTIRIKQLDIMGIDELKRRALQNLSDIEKMIYWNQSKGIEVFRLSSDIFPHMSNPLVADYGFEFAREHLRLCGLIANHFKQRLTFHPGQFNVLGTKDIKTLNKTINELDKHAEILDIMLQDQNGVIVIHGGGVYGNKEETMNRWVENFGKLSLSAQKRLVLENCEKSYTVRDCITISTKIYEKYGFYLPIVVDSHHYVCHNKIHPSCIQEPIEDLIPLVLNTWITRDIKPKFHISEQGNGKVGHHSDLIQNIPKYMLEIPKKYNIYLDIMVEAKLKEQAITKLVEKYDKCLNKCCRKLISSL